jgi:hypothetical protein
MEHEYSLLSTQKPVTGPYREPNKSSLHPHFNFKVFLLSTAWFPVGHVPSFFLTKSLYAFLDMCSACHMCRPYYPARFSSRPNVELKRNAYKIPQGEYLESG